MAHVYTPSKDAILTVQDAAERIKALEAAIRDNAMTISYLQGVALGMGSRCDELEKMYRAQAQVTKQLSERLSQLEDDAFAARLNAHADELRETGADFREAAAQKLDDAYLDGLDSDY